MWSIYQQKQLHFRIEKKKKKKKGGVRWKSGRGNGIKWRCRRELFYGSNNVHPYPSKVWASAVTYTNGWTLSLLTDSLCRWWDGEMSWHSGRRWSSGTSWWSIWQTGSWVTPTRSTCRATSAACPGTYLLLLGVRVYSFVWYLYLGGCECFPF